MLLAILNNHFAATLKVEEASLPNRFVVTMDEGNRCVCLSTSKRELATFALAILSHLSKEETK